MLQKIIKITIVIDYSCVPISLQICWISEVIKNQKYQQKYLLLNIFPAKAFVAKCFTNDVFQLDSYQERLRLSLKFWDRFIIRVSLNIFFDNLPQFLDKLTLHDPLESASDFLAENLFDFIIIYQLSKIFIFKDSNPQIFRFKKISQYVMSHLKFFKKIAVKWASNLGQSPKNQIDF